MSISDQKHLFAALQILGSPNSIVAKAEWLHTLSFLGTEQTPKSIWYYSNKVLVVTSTAREFNSVWLSQSLILVSGLLPPRSHFSWTNRLAPRNLELLTDAFHLATRVNIDRQNVSSTANGVRLSSIFSLPARFCPLPDRTCGWNDPQGTPITHSSVSIGSIKDASSDWSMHIPAR